MSLATKLLAQPHKFARKFLHSTDIRIPSLRFSERRLLLGFFDLVILSGTLLFLATNSPLDFSITIGSLWSNIHWFFVFWTVWFVFGFISDVYDLVIASNPIKSSWFAGGTAFVSSSIYLLIPYITPDLPERRLFIFLFP